MVVKRYEPSDPIPDEYRDLLTRLLWIQADTETYILAPKGWAQYAHIADLAPTMEDRASVAHYLAEECRHGHIFYRLLKDLGVEVTEADFEGPRELYVFEKWLESWTEFAIFNFLADRAGRFQAEEWIDSSYLPLARVAPAVVKDETGHGDQGYRNLQKICQTEAGHAEAQRILGEWYPVALDMFGSSASKRSLRYIEFGLKRRTNEEARLAFIGEVVPLIESLGLSVPDEKANRKFL